MKLLPLDDPRWKELCHRNWSNGKASDPDAPFVPDELSKLVENPGDLERFHRLWPWLASEGTTWQAGYAAFPYFVQLAKKLGPDKRVDYLIVAGFIVAHSCPKQGESFAIKDYLEQGYQEAITEALALLAETLVCRQDLNDTRYLLAAMAGLKGCPKLAFVLENLEGISGQCRKCGNWVYPQRLQDALS